MKLAIHLLKNLVQTMGKTTLILSQIHLHFSFSDSPVSSASESEYTHKNKKKSDSHSTSSSSKHKKHPSISPNRDTEETLNDQLIRQSQTYNKSPKRTIVITERKPEENSKRISKNSKSKSNPDIEFLGSKKIIRDKKSIETIHQQAENPKKSIDVKRERNSPSKSISSDQPRRYSSSTNEKILQIKTEHPSNKTQYVDSFSTLFFTSYDFLEIHPNEVYFVNFFLFFFSKIFSFSSCTAINSTDCSIISNT
jgi:hypothetical protein